MEAKYWELTIRLKDYDQARRLLEFCRTLHPQSSKFVALDQDGAPIWTDEDERRMERMLARVT